MNFISFSENFFKQFRFFGIHPVVHVTNKRHGSNRNVARDKLHVGLIVGLIVIYWFGIILSFYSGRQGYDHQMSGVSNKIQLILNAIALTTIFINTLLKFRTFDDVVQGFEVIDCNLKEIGRTIKYNQSLVFSRNILITFGIYIILSNGFDGYVTVVLYKMIPIWYWVIVMLPSVIYSMSLMQSIFIITWISRRCNLINSILSVDVKVGYFNTLPAIRTIIEKHKGTTKTSSDLIPKIFTIMNNICQLSRKVNSFMGLYLLSTIAAIFAVTCIQLFYVYVTATTLRENESWGFSLLSLLASLNIVIVNIFLVICLTTICEHVNTETMLILQKFSKLQINKEVPAELSIWLHPMISHLKITAYGFFSIDYTMLCGFMTAIMTYLVIFIQFYAIDPIHSENNNQRKTKLPGFYRDVSMK